MRPLQLNLNLRSIAAHTRAHVPHLITIHTWSLADASSSGRVSYVSSRVPQGVTHFLEETLELTLNLENLTV